MTRAPSPELDFQDFESHIKVFHELMGRKVGEILLVSTPYDAFIMEEDGSLTSKIIHEYRGLNLSRPPRLTRATTGKEAIALVKDRPFDMVITMPNLEDMATPPLVMNIKAIRPEMPVLLLAHRLADIGQDPNTCDVIDNEFIWTGNSELLLALVKSVEDRMNAESDTRLARVRVLLLVEDSPLFRSIFLPLIYKVVVKQTCSLMAETLNEEHRLLKMRARPKILVAENFEDAMDLFERFRPYVFGAISDTRFPKGCEETEDAGVQFLSHLKREVPHLPLLLLSSEPENRERAERIQAGFIDKNAPDLQARIEQYFIEHLGFGDFVFRLQDRTEVGRATNLRSLEKILREIPVEPIEYHARRNHFSNWLMARSEIALASRFAEVEVPDFDSIDQVRHYIVESIHALRCNQQRGRVARFNASDFDPDVAEFVRIGNGSLGGKARGLAFIASLLGSDREIHQRYPDLRIKIPKTLVVATDAFDDFLEENGLTENRLCDCDDGEIQDRFVKADLPEWLHDQLRGFLDQVSGPLSIRSSSLLEDAYFHSFAGLYNTYMIPNNHPDFWVRMHHLVMAIKLVFASTFFKGPLSFSKQISQQFQEDRMAVIIQQAAGRGHGDYFYPAISGTARSFNFYPFGAMKPEDGIVRVALGMGTLLDAPGAGLMFCPKHPSLLPQFSTVDDILANAQREFDALRIRHYPDPLDLTRHAILERQYVDEAETEPAVRFLASTYLPEEHRIRDTAAVAGPKLITFASILKHGAIPLSDALGDLLEIGRRGIGAPVEIEFAVDPALGDGEINHLYFLQLRPLSAGEDAQRLIIRPQDKERAFCFSAHSLGHGLQSDMADIVYVSRDTFESGRTGDIARDIGRLNGSLTAEQRPYLLIGPGRWGSADRFLGIPVTWQDISGVGAMIELRDGQINADASQGSHFFQKISSRGIHYITLEKGSDDFIDWHWITSREEVARTRFLRHVRLPRPFTLINDGKTGRCAMIFADQSTLDR